LPDARWTLVTGRGRLEGRVMVAVDETIRATDAKGGS